jgi:hypothetical protein
MSVMEVNAPVWYYEWDAGIEEHHIFSGFIRVIPGGFEHPHEKKHLTIYDPAEASGERNINNVGNVEEDEDNFGLDYWRLV